MEGSAAPVYVTITISRETNSPRDTWMDKHVKCQVPPLLTEARVLTWFLEAIKPYGIKQAKPDQPIKSYTGRFVKSISKAFSGSADGVITIEEVANLLNALVISPHLYEEGDVFKRYFPSPRLKIAETLWLDCFNGSPAEGLAIQLKDDVKSSQRSHMVAWAHGITTESATPYYQPNGKALYKSTGMATVYLKDGSRWTAKGTNTWVEDREDTIVWEPVKEEVVKKTTSSGTTPRRRLWGLLPS